MSKNKSNIENELKLDTLDNTTENENIDLENNKTEFEIKDKSEIAECFENLDCSITNDKLKIQPIDLNSRLSAKQIKAIFIIDTLVKMGIYDCGKDLTTSVKALAVSLAGKGREEKVNIIIGERAQRQGGDFWGKVKGIFQ